MRHVRKEAECDAQLVTVETADDVAEWCGGVAMPDGVVMLPAGPLSWTPVLPGRYIVRDGDRYVSHLADDFEAQWVPTEGE